jgi:hypothetical protein
MTNTGIFLGGSIASPAEWNNKKPGIAAGPCIRYAA